MSQGIECTPSFHQLYVRTFSAQGSIFFIYYINFVLHLYNKWPNFWCFEVFISAKCIYRIYLAFLYFILSKKKIFAIYTFCFFWPYYKYPRILVYFSLEKCSQNLKILLQIWIFLLWDVFCTIIRFIFRQIPLQQHKQ